MLTNIHTLNTKKFSYQKQNKLESQKKQRVDIQNFQHHQEQSVMKRTKSFDRHKKGISRVNNQLQAPCQSQKSQEQFKKTAFQFHEKAQPSPYVTGEIFKNTFINTQPQHYNLNPFDSLNINSIINKKDVNATQRSSFKQNQLTQYLKKIQILQKQLIISQKQKIQLQKQLLSIKQCKNQYQYHIITLQNQLREKIKLLQQNKTSKPQIQELDIFFYKHQLDNVNSIIHGLQRELKTMNDIKIINLRQIQNLQNKNNQLNLSTNNLTLTINDQLSEINGLKNSNKKLTDQLIKINDQLNIKVKIAEDLRGDLEKTRKSNQNNQKNTQLTIQYNRLNRKYGYLQSEYIVQQKKYQNLSQQLESLRLEYTQRIKARETQIDQNQQKIRLLLNQIQKIKQQRQLYQKQEQQIRKAREEQLFIQLEKISQIKQNLRSENMIFIHQIGLLREQLNHLTQQKYTLKTKISQYQQIQHQSSSKTKQFESLTVINENMKQSIEKYKKLIGQIQLKYLNQNKDLKNQIQKLYYEKQNQKKQIIQQMNKKIKDYGQQRSKQQNFLLKKLNQQIKQKQNYFNEKIKQIQLNYKIINQKLINDYEKKNYDFKQDKNKIQEQKNILLSEKTRDKLIYQKNLKQNISKFQLIQKKYQGQLQQLKRQNIKMSLNLTTETKLKTSQNIIREQKNEIYNLNKQIDKYKEIKQSLETNLNNLEANFDKKIKLYDLQIENFKYMNDELKQKINQIQQQNNCYKKQKQFFLKDLNICLDEANAYKQKVKELQECQSINKIYNFDFKLEQISQKYQLQKKKYQQLINQYIENIKNTKNQYFCLQGKYKKSLQQAQRYQIQIISLCQENRKYQQIVDLLKLDLIRLQNLNRQQLKPLNNQLLNKEQYDKTQRINIYKQFNKIKSQLFSITYVDGQSQFQFLATLYEKVKLLNKYSIQYHNEKVQLRKKTLTNQNLGNNVVNNNIYFQKIKQDYNILYQKYLKYKKIAKSYKENAEKHRSVAKKQHQFNQQVLQHCYNLICRQ